MSEWLRRGDHGNTLYTLQSAGQMSGMVISVHSQPVCFETGSTLEKRSPMKRERSHSHDSASSSLSSKASGESSHAGRTRSANWFLRFQRMKRNIYRAIC